MRNKTVLITGASGLIGKELIKLLLSKGYHVSILSRHAQKMKGVECYVWNPDTGEIDSRATQVDSIIHLAGENISAFPWSAKRKQAILDSRVRTTELLLQTIKAQVDKPKVFISASAIGFYGANTNQQKIFTEKDAPHNDFLGDTCAKWEQSVMKFDALGIRTVVLRTGIVLSRDGGALPKLTQPIFMGLGSPLGSGNQYMPWIHIQDLCSMYLFALENQPTNGPYNSVAPESSTNKELTTAVAHQLNRPLWLPNVPAWLLKLIFGEMAVILLEGSKVSTQKIVSEGFVFSFPSLTKALSDLFSRKLR